MNILALLSVYFVTLLAPGNLPGKDGDYKSGATEAKTSVLKVVVADKVSGELLPGVSVNIEGRETTYYTDLNGELSLENIKPGTYDITCSYISYQTVRNEKIRIEKNKLKAVNLELENIR